MKIEINYAIKNREIQKNGQYSKKKSFRRKENHEKEGRKQESSIVERKKREKGINQKKGCFSAEREKH